MRAHTVHRAPWESTGRHPLLEDKWELYHVDEDFSSANDLVAKNPKKLKELQELFLKEAGKYRVLPLDDRLFDRLNAELVGRPDLMAGRTSLTVYEGMIGMTENVFINIKNRSHNVTAEVTIPQGGANGVIISQAGRFGGWSLYLKDGKPMYAYNFLGLKTTKIVGTEVLPAGKTTIRFDFAYDGPGLGKGGTGTILVNSKKAAVGKIDRTHSGIFSADEGADVGQDGETPVSDDYKQGDNKFNGKIKKVVMEVGPLKLFCNRSKHSHRYEPAARRRRRPRQSSRWTMPRSRPRLPNYQESWPTWCDSVGSRSGHKTANRNWWRMLNMQTRLNSHRVFFLIGAQIRAAFSEGVPAQCDRRAFVPVRQQEIPREVDASGQATLDATTLVMLLGGVPRARAMRAPRPVRPLPHLRCERVMQRERAASDRTARENIGPKYFRGKYRLAERTRLIWYSIP